MKNSFSLTRRRFASSTALASLALAGGVGPARAEENSRPVALDSPDKLILKGCKAATADHLGRRALRLEDLPDNPPGGGGYLAVIPDVTLKNGTIEVELAGGPVSGPTPGFMGLAFHIHDEMRKFEHVYLRPKNGRHENQLQRNHACQYASQPDFGWKKLRDGFPGVYESYVDVEVDAWNKMKLEIHGLKLRLFVNDATQPCLVVNDLKLGEIGGGVALWIDFQTRAYFRNLRVTNVSA